MPVPKRKTSKRRRDQRSANKHAVASSFMDCKNCSGISLPHQVCKNCGFYKGQKVLETKLDRAIRRGEARKDLTPPAGASTVAVEEPTTGAVEAAPKAKKAAPRKTKKSGSEE